MKKFLLILFMGFALIACDDNNKVSTKCDTIKCRSARCVTYVKNSCKASNRFLKIAEAKGFEVDEKEYVSSDDCDKIAKCICLNPEVVKVASRGVKGPELEEVIFDTELECFIKEGLVEIEEYDEDYEEEDYEEDDE
ncbi:MAG: hypothetical protein K5912_00655 [Alphaproteobacteria bacterium]|nr:hypothetical protein [Alphaproteobacteria bacterium]